MFWRRDIPIPLQHASRRAFLTFVQQLTGTRRPTIAVQSDLDMFVDAVCGGSQIRRCRSSG